MVQPAPEFYTTWPYYPKNEIGCRGLLRPMLERIPNKIVRSSGGQWGAFAIGLKNYVYVLERSYSLHCQ